MKKLICLILFTAFILAALAGCNDTSTPQNPDQGPEQGIESEPIKDIIVPDHGGVALSISGIDAAKLLLAEEYVKFAKKERWEYELQEVEEDVLMFKAALR